MWARVGEGRLRLGEEKRRGEKSITHTNCLMNFLNEFHNVLETKGEKKKEWVQQFVIE